MSREESYAPLDAAGLVPADRLAPTPPGDGSKVLADNQTWVDPAGVTPNASEISFDSTGLTQTAAADVQQAIEDLDAAIDGLPGGHDAVTLAADADAILGLSTQQLTLDTQTANTVFAGPTSGGVADPTFRTLVAADVPQLTLPTVVAVGVSASGTGNVTPGLPTGHTTDDILLLFVQSDNQAIAAPATYNRLGPHAGFGTAGAAGATRLAVFWKRDGGAETDPTVLDTTDHTLAQIMAVRGCPTTGDPFLCVGSKRKLTASVTGTASAGATPVDACLVVVAFTHALDSASAVFSSPTNADLGSVTEQIDVATADGNGGGIGVFTGTKAKAGTFAATTVTETSTTDASMVFIMLPSGIDSRAGFIDRQVFLTPGLADTWTMPSGAKQVNLRGISGGAGGSSGRTASVAAGGGGGGGGGWFDEWFSASDLEATLTPTAGAGGAATANSDGAASNPGNISRVDRAGSVPIAYSNGGGAATVSATGSGGAGGPGGGFYGTTPAAGAVQEVYGNQSARGGTGGTTAAAGSISADFGGGGGAGGGTSQAASAGGNARRGAGGGGGGRSNTNVGTGGHGGGSFTGGGQTVGAAGADSPIAELGGGGGAGGTSAAGPGGAGGWPGGAGGGGGSQAAAQRGGAGADGVVVIKTFC